jgi:hypothetical protein
MLQKRIFVLATALMLAACQTGPSVQSIADPAADFSRYRSFGFASPLGTDRGGYQSIVSQTLMAAARRELIARGLTESPTPDIIVNFNGRLDERTKVTSTPAPIDPFFRRGYYGYRAGLYAPWPMYREDVQVRNIREGTLNIDIADAARKQLVWEGVVSGEVTRKQLGNLEAAISSAVGHAFERYPVPKQVP